MHTRTEDQIIKNPDIMDLQERILSLGHMNQISQLLYAFP